MSETIFKLQPDRTLALRGFDSFAAAATIHHATASGFRVSGTFRDQSDFAVAVLYDADNVYEHPRIRYLPDFNFSGLTLNFGLNYSDGLQPIDSPRYNWIDWATLDVLRADNSPAKVRLWDYAMLGSGTFAAATATVDITTSAAIQPYDRITLWYQNLAFDYIAPPGSAVVDFQFFAGGTGATHSITVNGRTYSHTESNPLGESSAEQADALIAAMAGDPEVAASAGPAAHIVRLTVRTSAAGIPIAVSASDGNGSATMRYTSTELAAAGLAAAVNAADWITANAPHAILAAASGSQVTLTAARYGTVNVSGTAVTWAGGTRFSGIAAGALIRIGGADYQVASVVSPVQLKLTAPATSGSGLAYVAPRGGSDGNLLEMYSLSRNSTMAIAQPVVAFSGGRSDVTWNVSLDFTALAIDQMRQCWLTFAPSLATGEFAAREWQAEFTNWELTGSDSLKKLQVAGPGSVRVEAGAANCKYTGTWNPESGFFSRYFAQVTSDAGATVTITYRCQAQHDLYLGTSLYADRAVAGIRVDGDAETTFDCRLNQPAALVTRRKVRSAVAAGKHTVTIRIAEAGAFYFDFLEAVVPSDVPAPLVARGGISPALDFDTDHTYKLAPSRLMWALDQLGYAGAVNEYLGVFWWNERARAGGSLSVAQVTFAGTFAAGDSVFLTLNGSALGKSVFPADTSSTIARHFAAYINSTFVGAWAQTAGGVLTVHSRSAGTNWELSLATSAVSSGGTAVVTQTPLAGVMGEWVIDDSVSPPLNRATRDWHADFYAQCAARSLECTTACSLELVNPPMDMRARFPDLARTSVATDIGFGSLKSHHCAAGNTRFLAYQKLVYRNIAQLQSAGGLNPSVQYGEFLWWFFAGPGGMAFYDDETMAAAMAALGRPLHIFQTPDDNPAAHAADALFLRNRLRDHLAALIADLRAAYPGVQCELLWPYDVNYPTPAPAVNPYLGGRLNRFVNLPVEWQQPATCGFDRVKTEALAFGSAMRDLDLAKEAVSLFRGFGWPLEKVRYLVPVFGTATPWHRELALAREIGMTQVNLWAWDHVCLYNLAVPEPGLERRSFACAA